MPRGDRSGPNGQGPMTGRRAGFCAGNDTPGFAGGGYGRGRGGRGRGTLAWSRWLRWGGNALGAWANRPPPPTTNQPDNEISELRRELAEAKARLAALEAKEPES